ncbi:hypothetical protein ANTRET_LOCUS9407 [Anthophora retusa]
MRSTLMLICVLATGLFTCIGAITVSIDRSDNKPLPTRSSMIANGWRPLTSGYENTIGTNVSPSSNLERNGPLHPVLGKLQEHMAVSEKLKPQRKGKPTSHHEYNPPSILGSFTVLGHAAAKARGEAQAGHSHANKHVASETREYTFLIPPPKDAFRFDLDQHRKPILRDSSAYLRQPQFAPPVVHQPPDPIKAATYFIKGYTSTTNSPSSPGISSKNRLYGEPYIPQLLQPPKYHQAKPFESLKVPSNVKPYFQPPGTSLANDFNKDKRLSDYDHRQNYEKYPGQNHHNDHLINPTSTGNFFSQVNHPGHSYKTSYERDPAFLVHESHEISYITPPSVYNPFNFRPSLPYETLLPPDVYSSSTPAPTTPRPQESIKYQQSGDSVQDYKRPGQSTTAKHIEAGGHGEIRPTAGVGNTYYVSEQQDLTPPPSAWPMPKNKYPSDINEVLPRVNPPSKFNQEAVVSNQIQQVPKVIYIHPQAQPPQYQSSVLPIDIRPENQESEYETPESISLKHFNEQQYLIQQQLLQRDRQRLAEQERQQQLEIEKQQQEELKKRQEELRQLLEQQKEDEETRYALETAKNQTEQLTKVTEEQPPYAVQLTEYEIPKVTTDLATVITEQSGFGEQPKVQQSQVTQPEYVISESPIIPSQQYQEHSKNQQEQVNYHEQQSDLRHQRPQKPLRDQYRRRKPSTVAYEPTPTEAPIQVPETSVPLTLHIEEVPIQTTSAPETVTSPTASSQKPRTRRPGSPLRRRRPTTTTPEPITVPTVEDYLKYDRPDDIIQQVDTTKRRRVKPTQTTYEETVTEKKTNIRKRPGHRNRVNHGEPFEAEIVTEIVHTPTNTYKSPTESIQSYEYNQYATNPPNQQFDYTSQKFVTVEEQREETTQPVPAEYFTEVTRAKPEDVPLNENYNPQQSGGAATNIPLEDLFIRTEGNYFDRATSVSSTSSGAITNTVPNGNIATVPPTTTSTVQSTTQPPPLSSSTSRSHKVRPIRYGNTTRPRFSIKDYKSRMDYKSRLAQVSSTEPSVTPASKQRGSLKSQQSQQSHQNAGEGNRETTGRYKYVSRMNYRTTTQSPVASKDQEFVSEDSAVSSTTERSNRFIPKRRPINGNVYRSRVSGTTSSPSRLQHHYENENQSKPSTARPENVFSSSVRRRPVMKSRLNVQRESSTAGYPERKDTDATEMAAEETSFYTAVTTTGTTRLVTKEIPMETVETASTNVPTIIETEKHADESETGQSFHSEKEQPEEPVASSTAKSVDESQLRETGITEQFSTVRGEETTMQGENKVETTTTFEVRSDEEELFAKASQSVADLTSSASALYDKPGMFKAVSPESRVVASHFKIPSDEPTLPIEAFFQELSKKS